MTEPVEKCGLKDKRGTCTALTVTNCKGCHFYKTKDQVERDKKISEDRLRFLEIRPKTQKKRLPASSRWKMNQGKYIKKWRSSQ